MHPVETYNDKVVRQFTIATIVWGVIGMTVGLFIAMQLAWPALNFDIAWLSYGRLRPLHTNAVIFAFGGSGLFATSYYVVQRTCHVRLFSDRLAAFTFWGWQAVIIGAVIILAVALDQSRAFVEVQNGCDHRCTFCAIPFARGPSRSVPAGAVIAAIDGFCLAGGLELALRCDIRIATEKSTFGLPEPRRSLLAGYGLHNLSRMIPLGEALHIQLTGTPISSQRAYDIGLIQRRVTDRDALMKEADAVADDICLCAPLAVKAIKTIVKTGRNMPGEYSGKMTEPITKLINATQDRLEGPKAFAEKRKPNWKMK